MSDLDLHFLSMSHKKDARLIIWVKPWTFVVIIENWAVTWDFQQCGMCDQQKLRPAWAYAQSDQSLCSSLEYSRGVQLLTEQNLELLSLKEVCIGSSESTLVKVPHCWKSHVTAQICFLPILTCLVPLLAFQNWTTSPEQWSNPVPVPCRPYQGDLSQLS